MYSEISNPELFKNQVLTELGKSNRAEIIHLDPLLLTQLVDACIRINGECIEI